MNYEMLTRPLYRLTISDLDEVRGLADTLFSRLCRPFLQQARRSRFSFDRTVRAAGETGLLLPKYEQYSRPLPKSRIVIAMSMSGVDRCYAVGLIPLLAQLRQALNFKLYIYTDDCVPAEFTPDGQIANDHAIAWNNSNWVNLFARMGAETFDPQEDHLLVIDSLGDGEESRWFSSWGESLRREAGEAQERYLTPEWAAARRLVAGRYDRVASIPPDRLPAGWADLVRRNTRERWLDTPALEHYLVRWAFNPDFGAVRHGTFAPLDKYYVSLRSVAGGLRYKFKTIHLLTPRTTQHTLDRLKYDIQPLNLVDFHHQVETLEGVASVFANIVFGKETVRLRVPEIRFTRPQADAAPAAHPDRPHTEMVKGLKCFAS